MRVRINPIVKKDLQVGARSMRISWGLFAYEGVLMLLFLLLVAIMQEDYNLYYQDSNIYGGLVRFFPALAVLQVFIVGLITPIITAGAISGERERQTLDIMLTTCMSPFSIVTGKLMSAVVRILFFVIAGMPIMAISFVVGGLEWSSLFYFVLAITLMAVFSGSIGIFCSSVCRKSIASVILSFVFYFVIYVLTFVPTILRALFGADNAGESALLWLFNPIIFFEEFFSQILTGKSLMGNGNFDRDDVGAITYMLTQGKMWMFVSAACILLLSLLFMLAAAWKVNPMHSPSGRRRGRKR